MNICKTQNIELINFRDAICITMIAVIHLKLSKFKHISNYMLIYATILKLSDDLDILQADA